MALSNGSTLIPFWKDLNQPINFLFSSLVKVQCVQQICNNIVYEFAINDGTGDWGHYQFDVISFDIVLNTDGPLFHYFRLSTFWFGGRTKNIFFWIDQIKALIKFRYIQLEFDTYFVPNKVNWQTVVYLAQMRERKKCNEIMSRRSTYSIITCCAFFPFNSPYIQSKRHELMGEVRSSVVC